MGNKNWMETSTYSKSLQWFWKIAGFPSDIVWEVCRYFWWTMGKPISKEQQNRIDITVFTHSRFGRIKWGRSEVKSVAGVFSVENVNLWILWYNFQAKFENEEWSEIGQLLHHYTNFNVAFMNNQFISLGQAFELVLKLSTLNSNNFVDQNNFI